MSKTYENIIIGESASFSKIIAEEDVSLFSKITGDTNPVHLDEEYAKNTLFGKRIAHGILTCGIISTVLGTYLPGLGTIFVSQDICFRAPVYLGDTITAVATVIEKCNKNKRIVLETICYNQDKKVVIEGKAVVIPPKN